MGVLMIKNKQLVAFATMAFSSGLFGVRGQTTQSAPSIVPRPAELTVPYGAFPLGDDAAILAEKDNVEAYAVGKYLAEAIRKHTGLTIRVGYHPGGVTTLPAHCILLDTHVPKPSSVGDEGYRLTVTGWTIQISAVRPAGLFRGVQTLRQLLPFEPTRVRPVDGGVDYLWGIPGVRIKDEPRYRWRGMLLDCCRHFMTKDFVKRYIDLLAYHKMNVLHWHLTEDQGWRIEIKKYPKLTEIGAWRDREGNRYGGFYTQDDIREVVAYAKSRYITVVPEIEMPGHSQAALAAYPELSCTGGPFEVGTRWGVYPDVYCAGNDRVFEFMEDVLTEVMELFPSEFIHIGGDECPKVRWEKCDRCQARIKAEGLKDEHELQSYFIRRIERFLNARGRRLIGWDEILEGGLAANATVQSWRGMSGAIAAATGGHDVIASPTSHCYLDYPQTPNPASPNWMGLITLERIYSFEPTPPELTQEQARHVLGAEANIWTERAPQDRVDHQVFPRLCALAEVTWSPKDSRDWEDFSGRMKTHYRRLDALGVTYYLQPPSCSSPEQVFTDSVEVSLENPLGRGTIRYMFDGSDPAPNSPAYKRPFRVNKTTIVKARTFVEGGNKSDVVEFRFEKQTPLKPTAVPSVQPGLWYAYYEGDWQRLPDFSKLTPVDKGSAMGFDLSVRGRDDRFAIRFDGFIRVPSNGLYTFYLTSDDGSRLWIGDRLVIDHDGLHSAAEKRGQIILKAGLHPIAVAMFESGGREHLSVEYAGPDIGRRPIPKLTVVST